MDSGERSPNADMNAGQCEHDDGTIVMSYLPELFESIRVQALSPTNVRFYEASHITA